MIFVFPPFSKSKGRKITHFLVEECSGQNLTLIKSFPPKNPQLSEPNSEHLSLLTIPKLSSVRSRLLPLRVPFHSEVFPVPKVSTPHLSSNNRWSIISADTYATPPSPTFITNNTPISAGNYEQRQIPRYAIITITTNSAHENRAIRAAHQFRLNVDILVRYIWSLFFLGKGNHFPNPLIIHITAKSTHHTNTPTITFCVLISLSTTPVVFHCRSFLLFHLRILTPEGLRPVPHRYS